jgi:hypothetical protein
MPINITKYEVPKDLDTSLMIGEDIHAFIAHLSRPEIRRYLYPMAVNYNFDHFRISVDAVAVAQVHEALAAANRDMPAQSAPCVNFLAELALDLHREVQELMPLHIFPHPELIQSQLDKYFERLK